MIIVTGRLNEAPSRAMSRSGATASRAGRLATGQSRQGQFTGGINKQPDNEALVSYIKLLLFKLPSQDTLIVM